MVNVVKHATINELGTLADTVKSKSSNYENCGLCDEHSNICY